MRNRSALAAVGVALLLGCQFSAPVRANGFRFFSAEGMPKDDGTHFVGSIRDEQGKPLRAARVALDIPGHNVTFVLWTDAEGRYRSTSIARTVDPKNVNLEAAKDGYTSVKIGDRKRVKVGAAQLIEVDFVMRKTAEK
ncbi:MAG: carboxypeptidase-like regulatory domain-containing protein [Pseudomonadota bacterium]|nr:carboxypeptidase-like regulatory domain-containing protein [Pseudomonadota bacterium]